MKKYNKYAVVIGIVGILLLLTGVTYSFFNYSKTGTANSFETGTINFSVDDGESISLTNVFPMTASEASEANIDTLTIGISGNTTYSSGEEFLISIVDVTKINNKEIPISYIATYTPTTGKTIGTEEEDYFTERESKSDNIYLLNETGEVKENKQVLVGFIKGVTSGIDGTLTIKPYVDADRIAITDTPEENADWVAGRQVFSTTEWNSLQGNNSISFKIKAEANEGIWVKKEGSIDSCPGCKFIYTETHFDTVWNTRNSTPTVLTSGYSDNYKEVVANSGKNVFIGVVLNENNQIERAYACGIKQGVINNGKPFCIEASNTSSANANNLIVLNQIFGPYKDNYGCDQIGNCADETGFYATHTYYNPPIDGNDVRIYDNGYVCFAYYNGALNCGLAD